jgi:hypothetical protein
MSLLHVRLRSVAHALPDGCVNNELSPAARATAVQHECLMPAGG